MRYALVALALLAGVALWLLLRDGNDARGVRRDRVSHGEGRGARGRTAEAVDGTAPDGAKTRAGTPEPAAPKCRLVYTDGEPAPYIQLKLAIGLPFRTRIYRDGDYPDLVVWLVTQLVTVNTGPDGWFTLPTGPRPRGARLVAYTELRSPAYVLAEVDPHQRDVAAVRRVRVTGRLRKPRGEAYDNEWVVVRDSRPETLRTWHSTEQDLFAHPTEGWLLHPRGQLNAITDADARFDLPVAPGRNWIVVGQHGEFGTHEFVAPEGGIDLGDIVVEPPKPTRPGNATLRGLVLDCAGRPRAGAQVELGDGNLGATSHYVRTDDQGRFACEGLKSERVVARAVTMPRKNGMFGGLSGVAHLPEQDSGTIRLPCNTPVTLTAPAREEILWVKPPHRGFYLFVRNGVCVGGSPLDTIDEFGLPPGNYHIVAVTDDGRILEGDRTVTEGGELRLEETDFRDTTHG